MLKKAITKLAKSTKTIIKTMTEVVEKEKIRKKNFQVPVNPLRARRDYDTGK